MKHNKLVRDRIPEIIEKSGKKAFCRILNDEEYKIELEKKLLEEVEEFRESKSLEELADIEEVLSALRRAYGYHLEELTAKRMTKVIERGAFTKRICLIETEERSNDEH